MKKMKIYYTSDVHGYLYPTDYLSDEAQGMGLMQASYGITYELDGGDNDNSNPATYTYGTGVTKFEPATKANYTFVGWFDAATNGNAITDISATATGAKKLYARWTPASYGITYELDGGDNDSGNPAAYTYGTGVTKFEPATKANYTFVGWFDAATNGNEITDISAAATGAKKLYARWTAALAQYNITYNLSGGSHSGNPTKYTYGVGVTSFANATKSGATFKGWYTAASGGAKITSLSATTTGNQTLYAQWDSPAIKVTNTAPGSEFDFAGSKWRILDTDMDNNAANGLQALVIRADSISISNKFIVGTTRDDLYFDNITTDGDGADGSNGYEDSRNLSIGGVGKVIDDWYKNNIAGTAAEAAVQAVNLNNPDFTTFKSSISFTSGSTITNWQWNKYHQDTRFATTLDSSGSKQAFALSYGDIHGHMGVGTTETRTDLLKLAGTFWLRSPGFSYQYVGVVDSGIFNYLYVFRLIAVRPALSLLIQ